MSEIQDDRHGLPSASSRERDYRCPGNRNLTNALRLEGLLRDDSSEASIAGDRIHKAIETDDDSELSHQETVSKEEIERKIFMVKQMVSVPSDAEEVRETRFWLRNGLRKMASAKIDVGYFWEDKCLVIDAKSGWLPVVPSNENLQLRGAVATILAERPSVNTVFTVIAPANEKAHIPAVYERATTGGYAIAEWKEHIKRTEEPDAPRIPGEEQCKYCPARMHCPERKSVISKVAHTAIHVPGLYVSDAELERLAPMFGVAKKAIGEYEAEMKRRLEDNPDCFENYELTKPRVTEKIVNLPVIFQRITPHGVTVDEFTKECTITKKNLTELLQSKLSIKGKALDTAVKEVIKDCTEKSYSNPSLKRREKKQAIEAEVTVEESIEGKSQVEQPILQG